MNYKIGRNDLCWCDSGKKYKKCHLNKESKEQLSTGEIFSKADKASAYSTCLHPKSSKENCGKIISAHTLQRSRVLKAVSDSSNHLLSFYPIRIDRNGQINLKKIGWKHAATFQAFCDVHDSQTFSPLETKDFIGSKEQIFLIAYRALCWELYQKVRAIKTNLTLREYLDYGKSHNEQRFIQDSLNVQESGLKKAVEDVTEIKKEMDVCLSKKNYSNYNAFEILVEGPTCIVSTGAVTPNKTLNGSVLQKLHDPYCKSEWLFFGVDISHRGTSIVFLWQNSENSPNKYVNEILDLDRTSLVSFLAQFFFAHCENTYFSNEWWDGLSSNQQKKIQEHTSITNPYYSLIDYDLNLKLTPWKILDIKTSIS